LPPHSPCRSERFGRVQPLRAGRRTVADGRAAVEPERVLQLVQALARRLVSAVDQPAVGLEQHRRPQIPLPVPPVAGAGGLAAKAENALIKAVKLGTVLAALLPFRGWFGRDRLQPGLDGGKLRVGN